MSSDDPYRSCFGSQKSSYLMENGNKTRRIYTEKCLEQIHCLVNIDDDKLDTSLNAPGKCLFNGKMLITYLKKSWNQI